MLRMGHELGFSVRVQGPRLDAVLGAHAGRRGQGPVPDGEAVRQPRHEQVRVAGAQLDRAEEAVFRNAEQVLEVRLLCAGLRLREMLRSETASGSK